MNIADVVIERIIDAAEGLPDTTTYGAFDVDLIEDIPLQIGVVGEMPTPSDVASEVKLVPVRVILFVTALENLDPYSQSVYQSLISPSWTEGEVTCVSTTYAGSTSDVDENTGLFVRSLNINLFVTGI